MEADLLKRQAAARALDLVQPGMRLGLGTGSTARYFLELLADRVCAGLVIVGVATSEAARSDAKRLGIPLTTLDETPTLDLTADGADEIGPETVIADDSKCVQFRGRFPLPIEVVPFGLAVIRRAVEKASSSGCPGVALSRRGDGHPFVTDGGHLILDAALERIEDPHSLAARLAAIPGVVEHGLFIELTNTAIISGPTGVRIVART
jgi:ribose 5-phosphate isomerase A